MPARPRLRFAEAPPSTPPSLNATAVGQIAATNKNNDNNENDESSQQQQQDNDNNDDANQDIYHYLNPQLAKLEKGLIEKYAKLGPAAVEIISKNEQQQSQKSTSSPPSSPIQSKILARNAAAAADPVLVQSSSLSYEGNVDSSTGLYDGQGKLKTIFGYEYQGEFQQGLMNGTGSIRWSKTEITYSGSFEKNNITGRGRYEWPSGDSYTGDVKNGLRHGEGTMFVKTPKGKSSFVGSWENGKRHGKGMQIYPDGSKYTGEWKNDRRTGKGQMTYCGNDAPGEYDGEWQNDVRHGNGKMKWERAGGSYELYEGFWVRGYPHGSGVATFVRMDPASSRVVQSAPSSGQGKRSRGQSQINRDRSSGATSVDHESSSSLAYSQSVAAVPSSTSLGDTAAASSASISQSSVFGPGDATGAGGKGMITQTVIDTKLIKAVNRYDGDFCAGKRHGFGTFVFDDGSCYEGFWKDNVKHGEGKFTTANGVVFVASFEHGVPTRALDEKQLRPDTLYVPTILPLYIIDILGPAEIASADAMSSIQALISSNYGALRRVFLHYCNSSQTTSAVPFSQENLDAPRAHGTMLLVQFLKFCSDCRLLSRHVTVAMIGRMFLQFKDRDTTTQTNAFFAESPLLAASTAAAGMSEVKSENSKEKGRGGRHNRPSGATTTSTFSSNTTRQTPSSNIDEQNRNDNENNTSSSTRNPRTRGSSTTNRNNQNNNEEQDNNNNNNQDNNNSQQQNQQQELSDVVKERLQHPWTKYAENGLHDWSHPSPTLQFRDFVEAVIRVACMYYNEPFYGSVSQRLLIVYEEHIVRFAEGISSSSLSSSQNPQQTNSGNVSPMPGGVSSSTSIATPLPGAISPSSENKQNNFFPFSRKAAPVLAAFQIPLKKLFDRFCEIDSLRHDVPRVDGGTSSSSSPKESVMTLRQVAWILKLMGILDNNLRPNSQQQQQQNYYETDTQEGGHSMLTFSNSGDSPDASLVVVTNTQFNQNNNNQSNYQQVTPPALISIGNRRESVRSDLSGRAFLEGLGPDSWPLIEDAIQKMVSGDEVENENENNENENDDDFDFFQTNPGIIDLQILRKLWPYDLQHKFSRAMLKRYFMQSLKPRSKKQAVQQEQRLGATTTTGQQSQSQSGGANSSTMRSPSVMDSTMGGVGDRTSVLGSTSALGSTQGGGLGQSFFFAGAGGNPGATTYFPGSGANISPTVQSDSPTTIFAGNATTAGTSRSQSVAASYQGHGGGVTSVADSNSRGGSPSGTSNVIDDATYESLLKSKLRVLDASAGYHGMNIDCSVAMDMELVFIEFVELLCRIATVLYTNCDYCDKVVQFMFTHVAPLAEKAHTVNV